MKKSIWSILALVVLLTMVVFVLGGCSSSEPSVNSSSEKAETNEPTATSEKSDETHSIGFVIVGLGNEFFEGFKAEFEKQYNDLGWEVDVANGEFNPQTQITAMENFIAMDKDVIVLWAVSPEPLNTVAQQAMDAGIKVVAFVQPLENYDACLTVDNVQLAKGEANLAAAWIDKAYPNAADRSVSVVLITRDNVDSTKEQGDVLRTIEDYSPKIKLVSTFDVDEESVEAGVNAAETIYTMNPENKVFLTVNSAVALGVNNYFTAMSSPVTEYGDMGIFTINGGAEITEQIGLSRTDAAPLRGTVMTGGIELSVKDCREVVDGVLAGTYANKYTKYGANLFIFGDTVDEYLETGNVTSVTESDFN